MNLFNKGMGILSNGTNRKESYMIFTSDPHLASEMSEYLVQKGFAVQAPEKLSLTGRVLIDGSAKPKLQTAVQHFLRSTGDAMPPQVKIKKVG